MTQRTDQQDDVSRYLCLTEEDVFEAIVAVLMDHLGDKYETYSALRPETAALLAAEAIAIMKSRRSGPAEVFLESEIGHAQGQ